MPDRDPGRDATWRDHLAGLGSGSHCLFKYNVFEEHALAGFGNIVAGYNFKKSHKVPTPV